MSQPDPQLTSQLRSARDEVSKLKTEIEAVKVAKDREHAQSANELNSQIEEEIKKRERYLKDQKESYDEEIVQLKQSIVTLETNLKQDRDKLGGKDSEISSLQSRIEALHQHRKAEKAERERLIKASNELTEANKKINAMVEDVLETFDDLGVVNSKNFSPVASMPEATSKIELCSELFTLICDNMAEAQGKIRELESLPTSTNSELDEMKKSITELEATVKDLGQQKQDLQTRMNA